MSHPARRRLAGRFVTYAIRGRRHTNVVEHEPLSVYRTARLRLARGGTDRSVLLRVLPSFSRGFVHFVVVAARNSAASYDDLVARLARKCNVYNVTRVNCRTPYSDKLIAPPPRFIAGRRGKVGRKFEQSETREKGKVLSP